MLRTARNAGTAGLTATNNPRQTCYRMLREPGTCYARPIYPQINTCNFLHFPISLLLKFYRQIITVYFTLLVHQACNWQKIVLGIEKLIDGIRYLHISPKNSGYKYDTISRYTVSCDIALYGTCLDISRYSLRYHIHQITSKNQAHKSKFNENPPPRCGLLFVFFGFVSALILAVFVWPFLSFFCCPSAGHIIGLTVSPANSNLVPSGLGLLPERMHVCFCFIFHLFSFLSFPVFSPSYLVLIPGTPYSSYEVPEILLLLT